MVDVGLHATGKLPGAGVLEADLPVRA
jgi:hypothetical protein